ncbi:MAG: M20 family metallopeptidase [Oscillospiraceae bacterium]|nr:M20 family metallopeptidase [Oscillospiraceae bacterium]
MNTTQPDFISMATELAPWLTELRGRFHRRPELGDREYTTAGVIESALSHLDIGHERLLDTAVVGLLSGGRPGRTAAFRADMDALPIQEQTDAPFASVVPGCMHACGHDFHMTATLGAAALLAQCRERLPGNVKLLFQPAEEGIGGAERMIAAGCLENPHVDAVFGCHVSPDLPAGTVGIRYGKFYAASNPFAIRFLGRSAHGAEPEKGADAIAAASTVCALLALRQTLTEKNGPTVISVGIFQGGDAENIIAEHAHIQGIIRTLGPEARRQATAAVRQTALDAAEKYGVQADVHIRESYPGVVNHDNMSLLAERAARSLLGDSQVTVLSCPTMTTEDFGYFIENTPGCFYHFGVGGDYPLHSDHFLPDSRLLPLAAAAHAAVIWEYLTNPGARD